LGAIFLFGCLSLGMLFSLWPKGNKRRNYWYQGYGLGTLSKTQVIIFLGWFLIGGSAVSLAWLNDL